MIAKPPPDARLRFDPQSLGLVEPGRSFYRRTTVRVARDLLGAWIARRRRGRWYGARIVETEAYLGPGDAAAHSFRGRRTSRVEPMYADGGHLYVVTRRAGQAEAVLLRAAEGGPGAPARLLSGPGKLCAALGITGDASGSDLLGDGDLRILRRPRARRPRIGVSARIGVDYAGEASGWALRFFDVDSAAVSRR